MATFTVKPYLQAANKAGYAPIYIRYTFQRSPQALPASLSIEPTKWDAKKGMVSTNYPEAKIINPRLKYLTQIIEDIAAATPDFPTVKERFKRQLEIDAEATLNQKQQEKKKEFKGKIDDVVNHLEFEEAVETKQKLKQDLNDVQAKLDNLRSIGYDELRQDEELFFETLTLYQTRFLTKTPRIQHNISVFIRALKNFAKDTGYGVTFNKMDDKFYRAIGFYLMYRCNPERTIKYNNKHDYYNTAFTGFIKLLKTFLKHVEEKLDIPVNKLYKSEFKYLKEEKYIEILTPDELEMLWEFQKHLQPYQIKYVHLTYFQSQAGLRYSDVFASGWKMHNGKPEDNALKGTTIKNNKKYFIPLSLNPRLDFILQQYNYNLRLVDVRYYNEEIKEILKRMFYWNNMHQQKVTYYRMKFQERIPFEAYKHELISSHSNRRYFVTNKLNEGYSEKEILTMLGSVTISEFRKYQLVNENSILAKTNKINQIKGNEARILKIA